MEGLVGLPLSSSLHDSGMLMLPSGYLMEGLIEGFLSKANDLSGCFHGQGAQNDIPVITWEWRCEGRVGSGETPGGWLRRQNHALPPYLIRMWQWTGASRWRRSHWFSLSLGTKFCSHSIKGSNVQVLLTPAFIERLLACKVYWIVMFIKVFC